MKVLQVISGLQKASGVLVTDPLSRSAWTDALSSAAHTAARSLDLDEVYGKVLANLQPAAFDGGEGKICSIRDI